MLEVFGHQLAQRAHQLPLVLGDEVGVWILLVRFPRRLSSAQEEVPLLMRDVAGRQLDRGAEEEGEGQLVSFEQTAAHALVALLRHDAQQNLQPLRQRRLLVHLLLLALAHVDAVVVEPLE
eukprot:1568277-Rhodomonas_salina.1